MRKMTREECTVLGLAGAIVAGACILLGFPSSRREPGTERTRSDIISIHTALLAYRNEFGKWPDGGTADILLALRGENPGKVTFLDLKDKAPTLMLDAWGMPYKITIVSNAIIMATAGPNRTWGDSDDLEIRRTEQRRP